LSGIFGGGSQSADRAAQLNDQEQLTNVFSWALPAGQQNLAQGQQFTQAAAGDIGQAQNYYQNLLTAGRTQTAQRLAPAIQGQLNATDAQKRQNALMGDSRTGGATAANAEANSTANASIDQIVSQGLQTGQAQGAAGLSQVGSQEAALAQQENQLGLGLTGTATQTEEDLLQTALQSRMNSAQIQQQQGAGVGALLGMALDFAVAA
jgi:hypothetical protein